MCYFWFPLKLLTFCSTWVQSDKSPKSPPEPLPGYYCCRTSLQVFLPSVKSSAFIRQPCGILKRISVTSAWAPRGRLRVWCVVVTVGAGGEAAGAAVSRPRRPSPLTGVYFCRASPFIFTRVLMSILICLLRCFRWVIGECVGTCENSLCLVLGHRDAHTAERIVRLKTHTHMRTVSCGAE